MKTLLILLLAIIKDPVGLTVISKSVISDLASEKGVIRFLLYLKMGINKHRALDQN